MKDRTENPIVAYQGIEIYGSDVEIVCQDYIDRLPDINMIYTKSAIFLGMLDSVYKRVLKPLIYNPEQVKQQHNYKLLDDIFYAVYCPICFRFNKTPTIVGFCSLVGLDQSKLYEIKTGVYHDGSKVNITTCRLITKWYSTCEAALVNKTVDENGIGSMFLLKAKYGYRDNQTLTIETGSKMVHETAAEIAERYANTRLPEKPEL